MLERLGPERLAARVEGDGAGDMIDALASRDPAGGLAIVVWNGTVDVAKVDGDPLLDRHVEVVVTSLPEGRYRVRHRRLDERHSNVNAAWARVSGGRAWPDEAGWRALHQTDRLEELEPTRDVAVSEGALRLAFDLPMPAVSLIELDPH
jgi:xylan 1,4-beta-xylosidase